VARYSECDARRRVRPATRRTKPSTHSATPIHTLARTCSCGPVFATAAVLELAATGVLAGAELLGGADDELGGVVGAANAFVRSTFRPLFV
jgi:hypothetical protein